MKRSLFIIVALMVFNATTSFGQIVKPASWNVSLSKSSAKIGDKVDVVFNATIKDSWHVYSNDFDPDLGPLLISFEFNGNPSYKKIGDVKPINAHKKYDDLWEGDVSYFETAGELRQTIEVLKLPLKVTGSFEYQSCSEETGQCVLGDDEFDLSIGGGEGDALAVKNEPVKELPSSNLLDANPEEVSKSEGEGEVATIKEESTQETELPASGSLWGIFILAFLGGLAAIFTPCVFPMIPMTVSFFMHSDENKRKARLNAFFYGFSIIAIYTVIGTAVALIFGANFANFISTHWLPNILFFVIFIVFAASFFGMFEITMPSGLVNKSVKNEDKGGMLGSFFMAFTLVLVSFSCTGPIVGAILVASAGGEVLMPIVGMLGFSLAFALPFTLFAIFPGWLNNLPKSGGWLNSVKVVLGFIEVALGLKFLSIADQTYHWGLLDREIYLAIWIVVFTLLGFYLLGKLKFAHDSEVKYTSVPRLMLAIITFSFVVYMIPGMFGAPLKALSGYIPPQSTHDFDLNQIIRENAGDGTAVSHNNNNKAKYSKFLHLPHGLTGYFDYNEGLAAAKRENKPVFIDFTGHGCVNCRQMEANVWSDPRVLKRLQEDYIIVALYVDDKTKLPESEWVTGEDGKIKKTLGKINANFQITRYKVNAQPYYCLLGTNGENLVPSRAYNLDVDSFVEFLDEGIKNFKQNSK